MTAVLVLTVVLLVLAGLGVASALGRTADTRDPAYGAGRLLDRSTRT